MTQDELKQINNVRELVLKQVDTIIATYTSEKSDKYFTSDVRAYLLTVGSGMVAEGTTEYYQFPSKELAEKVYKAFVKESRYYNTQKRGDYCNVSDIQSHLKKFRLRIAKMLTPGISQAERNLLFQAKVLSQLNELYEAQKTFTKVLQMYADTFFGEIQKLQIKSEK
ncbi:MAG: hypothetical protein J6Z01_05620 [Bacteroidales bacterium]|nr:hypothetical protein [Bacteroidales bacterium]